jgi:hypothetical protein
VVPAFRVARDGPAPALSVRRGTHAAGTGLRCRERSGQHAQVALEPGRAFGEPRGSGAGGVVAGQSVRTNNGGVGQLKRERGIVDVMAKAADERGCWSWSGIAPTQVRVGNSACLAFLSTPTLSADGAKWKVLVFQPAIGQPPG